MQKECGTHTATSDMMWANTSIFILSSSTFCLSTDLFVFLSRYLLVHLFSKLDNSGVCVGVYVCVFCQIVCLAKFANVHMGGKCQFSKERRGTCRKHKPSIRSSYFRVLLVSWAKYQSLASNTSALRLLAGFPPLSKPQALFFSVTSVAEICEQAGAGRWIGGKYRAK